MSWNLFVDGLIISPPTLPLNQSVRSSGAVTSWSYLCVCDVSFQWFMVVVCTKPTYYWRYNMYSISPQQYSEALLMYWSYEILGVMGTLFLLINMGVTSGWVLIICRVWWDFINCLQTQIGWVGGQYLTQNTCWWSTVCVWQVLISTILAAVLATLPPPTAAASSGQWHWSHDWHHTSTTPTNILLYRKYWWYLI